jgi:hypothetical protein
MAAIDQGVVVEAPCVVLEVVAAEQVLDAVDVVPVVPVPVVHAPQWGRTGRSSALNSGASPNLRLERLSP